MEPFDERHEAENQKTSEDESNPAEWVPDLEERLLTIERANVALERARTLLERVNRLENIKAEEFGDGIG